jgi:hypothetical protein
MFCIVLSSVLPHAYFETSNMRTRTLSDHFPTMLYQHCLLITRHPKYTIYRFTKTATSSKCYSIQTTLSRDCNSYGAAAASSSHSQWRIQGGWGDTSPHRPQTPRPRKKFVCENSKFFRRFAPIIVQLIKNIYNNITGKCQNCRELQLQYFLHAWG